MLDRLIDGAGCVQESFRHAAFFNAAVKLPLADMLQTRGRLPDIGVGFIDEPVYHLHEFFGFSRSIDIRDTGFKVTFCNSLDDFQHLADIRATVLRRAWVGDGFFFRHFQSPLHTLLFTIGDAYAAFERVAINSP
jgi:hypothetical protein